MTKTVRFHLPNNAIRRDNFMAEPFYGHMAKAFEARNIRVAFEARKSQDDLSDYSPDDFHFVHEARIVAPNVLNTGASYLGGYWYVDRAGVMGDSNTAKANFDADGIDPVKVEEFWQQLYQYYVVERRSKLPQTERIEQCPAHSIGVFFQGASQHVHRYGICSEFEMLEAIYENRGGRDVVVKFHPNRFDFELVEQVVAFSVGRPDLHIVEANVHDIIGAADFVCAISSGVCIQAMLHKTPSVLFGRTDFHHAAVTVNGLQDVAAAFERVQQPRDDYAAFLFWFFNRQMIYLKKPNSVRRVIQRMERNCKDLDWSAFAAKG
jgi:hypothetical protein